MHHLFPTPPRFDRCRQISISGRCSGRVSAGRCTSNTVRPCKLETAEKTRHPFPQTRKSARKITTFTRYYFAALFRSSNIRFHARSSSSLSLPRFAPVRQEDEKSPKCASLSFKISGKKGELEADSRLSSERERGAFISEHVLLADEISRRRTNESLSRVVDLSATPAIISVFEITSVRREGATVGRRRRA